MTHTAPNRLLAWCALLLFAIIGLSAHAGPKPAVALPNGYYLERNDSGHIQLVTRKKKKVISEPIAGYAVHRLLVFGLVGTESLDTAAYPNEKPLPEVAEPRYFVLDTTSGKLEKGLTLDDWKSRLSELGVPSTTIRAPALP